MNDKKPYRDQLEQYTKDMRRYNNVRLTSVLFLIVASTYLYETSSSRIFAYTTLNYVLGQLSEDAKPYNNRTRQYLTAFTLAFLGEINDLSFFSAAIAYAMLAFVLNSLTDFYSEGKDAAKEAENLLLFYEGESELREAAKNDNVELMEQFFNCMSKVRRIRALDADSGQAPLHFAVQAGALKAINYLLTIDDNINDSEYEPKPDIINIQDYEGNTPVHLAIKDIISGRRENFQVLLALFRRRKIQPLKLENENLIPPKTYIDILLKDSQGKTVIDLIVDLLQVGPKDQNPNTAQAFMMLRQIKQYHDQEIRKSSTCCNQSREQAKDQEPEDNQGIYSQLMRKIGWEPSPRSRPLSNLEQIPADEPEIYGADEPGRYGVWLRNR